MPEWLKIVLRPLYFRIRHWRGNQGIEIHACTISGITREYGSVHTFQLDCEVPFDFTAGQYGHVIAPGAIVDNHHVQHISLASAPHESRLLISMDLGSGSKFKRKFAKAAVGDRLGIYSVKGDFVLPKEKWDRPVLMIAGGIGITPIRALASDFILKRKSNWSLVYAGKDYLYQELWSYHSEQVEFVKRETIFPALEASLKVTPEALVYLCGAGDFVATVQQFLIAHGVEPISIQIENFNE